MYAKPEAMKSPARDRYWGTWHEDHVEGLPSDVLVQITVGSPDAAPQRQRTCKHVPLDRQQQLLLVHKRVPPERTARRVHLRYGIVQHHWCTRQQRGGESTWRVPKTWGGGLVVGTFVENAGVEDLLERGPVGGVMRPALLNQLGQLRRAILRNLCAHDTHDTRHTTICHMSHTPTLVKDKTRIKGAVLTTGRFFSSTT